MLVNVLEIEVPLPDDAPVIAPGVKEGVTHVYVVLGGITFPDTLELGVTEKLDPEHIVGLGVMFEIIGVESILKLILCGTVPQAP